MITVTSVHQITKILEFLSDTDKYIEDAKKDGDSESEKVWNTIKDDRQENIRFETIHGVNNKSDKYLLQDPTKSVMLFNKIFNWNFRFINYVIQI